MGIDALDINFRLEKTFDVTLSKEDFTGLLRDGDVTVGDLYDLLLKKLQLSDLARNNIHLNFFLWTDIQHNLESVCKIPSEQIELKTPLKVLFPKKTRRATWNALRGVCPYRIQELDYSIVVRGVGFALAAGMALVDTLQLWQIPGVRWLWPVMGLLGIWMLIETYFKLMSIFAPLRRRFPNGMSTVKDLCRAVLAANYEKICGDFNVCSEAKIYFDERSLIVWQRLKEILVNVLGVDEDEITFRSRLVKDLGMA